MRAPPQVRTSMPKRVALITGATGQDGAYFGAWHKAPFII
jgi:hypothetical protein